MPEIKGPMRFDWDWTLVINIYPQTPFKHRFDYMPNDDKGKETDFQKQILKQIADLSAKVDSLPKPAEEKKDPEDPEVPKFDSDVIAFLKAKMKEFVPKLDTKEWSKERLLDAVVIAESIIPAIDPINEKKKTDTKDPDEDFVKAMLEGKY